MRHKRCAVDKSGTAACAGKKDRSRKTPGRTGCTCLNAWSSLLLRTGSEKTNRHESDKWSNFMAVKGPHTSHLFINSFIKSLLVLDRPFVEYS